MFASRFSFYCGMASSLMADQICEDPAHCCHTITHIAVCRALGHGSGAVICKGGGLESTMRVTSPLVVVGGVDETFFRAARCGVRISGPRAVGGCFRGASASAFGGLKSSQSSKIQAAIQNLSMKEQEPAGSFAKGQMKAQNDTKRGLSSFKKFFLTGATDFWPNFKIVFLLMIRFLIRRDNCSVRHPRRFYRISRNFFDRCN